MGRRLKVTTILSAPAGSGESFAVFGPDDEVPDWAAAQIGDHAWEGDADAESSAPAKSANKSEWVAFAVTQGADEADAEAMTKDELVAQYGE